MTINEAIADIKRVLESGESVASIWGVTSLVRGRIPLHFTDSRNDIYLRRGDNDQVFISFKVKRKRVSKHRGNFGVYAHEMVPASITLETPDVGDMTVEQVIAEYERQRRAYSDDNAQKEREDYLKVKAVLDATGMTITELWRVSRIVDRHGANWDKLERKWGDGDV